MIKRLDRTLRTAATGSGQLLGGLALAAVVALGGCSGSSSAKPDGGSGPIVRDPDPPPAGGNGDGGPPRVELTASEASIAAGSAVDLIWSSSNASECTASGGWSGSRPTQGRATSGPLTEDTTFTLSCGGADGNAVGMVSVTILGLATLSWRPPTENVDGTPLTDLAGYRIYYGTESRSYTDQEDVPPGVTRMDFHLASGSYYFAMTAIDGENNESDYSNEVTRDVF